MTRFPVSALRSVDLGTPDLGCSERFYVIVWGLELVARHNGVVYLRAAATIIMSWRYTTARSRNCAP